MSAIYSPQWCPDFTCLHGDETGSHILVDVTVPSVVKQTALPVASHDPKAVTESAEASKRATYGNVAPDAVVLPFVIEDSGGMGTEAAKFFCKCRDKVKNELSHGEEALSNWSCYGFSNFYRQSFATANAKGMGHYFMATAALLRTHGGIPS